MKWMLIALLLSGCAGYEPMTIDQRIAYMRAVQAGYHPLAPLPVLTVPQQRQPLVCTAGYNNTVICQ